MKYKKYIWIFFIFAITFAVVYYIRKQNAVEGFMTEDEFVTEANHRIKTMQAIKASINDSLNAFDKSAKETCDLTIKYRDAFVSATAALPKYNSLTNDDRQKTARVEYDEQRIKYIASGKPIYECFATQDEVDAVTKKLKSEMKELSDLLDSPRLRTMLQKGKLLDGLQGLNSKFSGSKMVFEAFVVDEDLLESADILIKEARSVQTVARVAITNTTTLQSDFPKIPDFVKFGSKITSNYSPISATSIVASPIPSILQVIKKPIKVAIISTMDKYLNNFKKGLSLLNIIDIVLEQFNPKLQEKEIFNISFPEYSVIIIYIDAPEELYFMYDSKLLNPYIESGGNIIFGCNVFYSKKFDTFNYKKYTSFIFKDNESRSYDRIEITIKGNHPIISNDINDKKLRSENHFELLCHGHGRVLQLYDKNDLILTVNTTFRNERAGYGVEAPVYAVYVDSPIIAGKKVESSRFLSLAFSTYSEFNDIGLKLLARCILWAAGRI